MLVINSHWHRPWQRGQRHIVSPFRKISSWLQHSDSYSPDFFASSEVFIKAPFNLQAIVHKRFHQAGIDKSGVWRPRAHDELLTSGQVAESLLNIAARAYVGETGCHPAGLLESELFGHEKGAFIGPLPSESDASSWHTGVRSFLTKLARFLRNESQRVR